MSFYLHESLITDVNQTKTTPGPVWVIHFYVLVFDSLNVLHLNSNKVAAVNILQCIVMESSVYVVRICRLMSFFN